MSEETFIDRELRELGYDPQTLELRATALIRLLKEKAKWKKELEQEQFNHMNTRISWDSTTAERDELKHRCKALEDKINIITEKYNINI